MSAPSSGFVEAKAGVHQANDGEALSLSAEAQTVAKVDSVAPTLQSINSELSSDTLKLTLIGFGFDNTGFCGSTTNCSTVPSAECVRGTDNVFNQVLFYPSRGEVTGYISCATRDSLVVSFDKLDARHVGPVTAQVGFAGDNCNSKPIEFLYSENASSPDIVPSMPDIDQQYQNKLDSVDVEPGVRVRSV
jgi:hypothetical protein